MKIYDFNPIKDLGLDIPKDKREEALAAAAEYLKQAMLEYIGDGESPVAGGKWRRSLTKDYKALKGEESSSTFANLELHGDFLDSLNVDTKSNKVIIEVDKDQEGKAEAFLTGQYGSGTMKADYRREFAPTKGKTFKKDILQGLKDILAEFEDG